MKTSGDLDVGGDFTIEVEHSISWGSWFMIALLLAFALGKCS